MWPIYAADVPRPIAVCGSITHVRAAPIHRVRAISRRERGRRIRAQSKIYLKRIKAGDSPSRVEQFGLPLEVQNEVLVPQKYENFR